MANNKISVDGVPTLQVNDPNSLTGLKLIDVRRPEEFTGELGHIKGAELITLGPDLENYLTTANKDEPILFICRSGARSANSTMYALSIGIKEAYNMEGGMILWNEKKFPITKNP